MSNIKISYYSGNTGTIPSSTTFSDSMARFFIRAWYGMQRLLEEVGVQYAIRDKSDPYYRDIEDVKVTFQKCIDEMMVYVDKQLDENDIPYTKGWTKREIEHHMLVFIRDQAQGHYLHGELD